MGCNCKAKKFEERYGEPVEEDVLIKGVRYAKKVAMFFIALIMGLLVTPVVILFVIWKITITNSREIRIPRKILELLGAQKLVEEANNGEVI